MAQASSPKPAKFKTDAQLLLYGRWGENGIAIVRDGQREVEIALAPGQFNLLAILVEAAKKPPGPSWVPSGYITNDELCRELTRLEGGKPENPFYENTHINRMIYKLRDMLAKAMFPEEEEGRAWVKRFLERGALGYRLSTSPANLELEMKRGYQA